MNLLRNMYDRLSPAVRGRLRALLPDGVLRWYAHCNTDVYLLSYPKCGRTWVRLMIGKAIAGHFGLPGSEEILFLKRNARWHPQMPRIKVIHDDRPMFKTPEELEQSKARYRSKQVIFLVRDPRDVVVSYYFERSKRRTVFEDNPYEPRNTVFTGSLVEFIHSPIGGFDTIIEYYNIWARNRQIPKGFLLVRYEDLRADPHAGLRRMLDFIGLAQISDEAIAQAVEFASFDNMRKMETENKFQDGMLKPADKTDQNTYKTRKGKVKGFTDHLDASEIEGLNRKMQEDLADIYGYINE